MGGGCYIGGASRAADPLLSLFSGGAMLKTKPKDGGARVYRVHSSREVILTEGLGTHVRVTSPTAYFVS